RLKRPCTSCPASSPARDCSWCSTSRGAPAPGSWTCCGPGRTWTCSCSCSTTRRRTASPTRRWWSTSGAPRCPATSTAWSSATRTARCPEAADAETPRSTARAAPGPRHVRCRRPAATTTGRDDRRPCFTGVTCSAPSRPAPCATHLADGTLRAPLLGVEESARRYAPGESLLSPEPPEPGPRALHVRAVGTHLLADVLHRPAGE